MKIRLCQVLIPITLNAIKKVQKPFSNILYSAVMGAVDVADRHLPGVEINVRTQKWYLNVFCKILLAAILEMRSCYTEELGESPGIGQSETPDAGVQWSKEFASTNVYPQHSEGQPKF